jgi:hypothetical protein
MRNNVCALDVLIVWNLYIYCASIAAHAYVHFVKWTEPALRIYARWMHESSYYNSERNEYSKGRKAECVTEVIALCGPLGLQSKYFKKKRRDCMCSFHFRLIFAFLTNFSIQLHHTKPTYIIQTFVDYYHWISVSVLNHKSMATRIQLPKDGYKW